MALAPYTTTAEVRAALGVSALDISDTVLNLQIYNTMMVEALRSISPTFETDYAVIAALSSPTSDQTRFLNLTSAFATYAVAKQLIVSAPLFAPRVIKDDKTEMDRVTDPFANLGAQITAGMAYIQGLLTALYAALVPSATPNSIPAIISVDFITLGTDPVTG